MARNTPEHNIVVQLPSSRPGVDLGLYLRQQQREARMVEEGLDKYRDAYNELAKEGVANETTAGMRFLREIMVTYVPQVESLQDTALKTLATGGRKFMLFLPLVLLDAERMAYIVASLVTSYQTWQKPSLEKCPGTLTPRPLRDVARDVVRQIVRERRLDLRAESIRQDTQSKLPKYLRGRRARDPLGEVRKLMDESDDPHKSRQRKRFKRLQSQLSKLDKELATRGAMPDILRRKGMELIVHLALSCQDKFELLGSTESKVWGAKNSKGKRHKENHIVLLTRPLIMLRREYLLPGSIFARDPAAFVCFAWLEANCSATGPRAASRDIC